MKYSCYYKWVLAVLACGCLFLFGVVLPHSTSLAFNKFTLATPTPRSTIVTITTPEVRLTPTVGIPSQTSTHSTNSDPSTAIAIVGLIIAFLGIAVEGVTLYFIIKYVRDTASMAIATRDSADATRDSARAAENTLQEMKAAREEENAPFVVVYFNYIHRRHQSLYLVVENTGKSIARDIKLEFTPALQVSQFNKDRIANNMLLKNGIKSLVPNYKIPIPFDFLMHYVRANLPMEYTVKVTYWGNPALPPIVLEYPLDLTHFQYIDFVTETGLSEIDETLQRFADHFSHYSWSTDTTNNLLNHIANAINRGLIIKNRISVGQNNVDIPTILKEFVYLWVVDYGKQTEKWNDPFIFGLRAKCHLFGEELLQSVVILDSQAWAEPLKQIISNLSKLSSMRLSLDNPEGTFSSAPMFLSAGSSKEDFDSLGDSILAGVRTVIELIEKKEEIPLNGNYQEEVLLSTTTEHEQSDL
jgi:hypothetical protein